VRIVFHQLFFQVAFAVAVELGFSLVHTVKPFDFVLVQFEFQHQKRIAHRTEQNDSGCKYGNGFSHSGKASQLRLI
jgi:hypothetical protein